MSGCKPCGTAVPPAAGSGTQAPCKGRRPFFEPFNASCSPYPQDSIVYDACGFYVLPCGPEYAPPRAPGSKWVPFDASVFVNLIQHGMGDACSFMFPRTSSDDKDPFCMPNYKRVWKLGEIRCHDGFLHCSRKADNATDPEPNGAPSAEWSAGMSASQIICSVLSGPAIRTALGWNTATVGDKTIQVIDWLYDSMRGLGIDPTTNKAYVKLAEKAGLAFDNSGKLMALVDNETIKIGTDGKLYAVVPSAPAACASPCLFGRIDAVVKYNETYDVPAGTAVATAFDQDVNISVAGLGFPACADMAYIQLEPNISFNADPGSPWLNHMNVEARLIADGIAARAYGNQAVGLYGDWQNYDKNSGFVRLNADGTFTVNVRVRGNNPGGGTYAKGTCAVQVLGWAKGSVVTPSGN